MASGDENGVMIIWETQTGKALWRKEMDGTVHSIDWGKHNLIAFSHGEYVEIMVWKYPRKLKKDGEDLIEQTREAAVAAGKNGWAVYEEGSSEYKEGLRVGFKLESDVTHLEFEKTKGDYLVSVTPDNIKKNEVVAIHRLSSAATQTNFIKGKGIFRSVSFFPKKPQIIILTTGRVVIFDLEELSTVKKLTSGDNTYNCMAVHPYESYIMVGSSSNKVPVGRCSCCATIWT